MFVGVVEQAPNRTSSKIGGWKASGFARECVEDSSLALLWRSLAVSNRYYFLKLEAKAANMSMRWRRIESNYSFGLGLIRANGL